MRRTVVPAGSKYGSLTVIREHFSGGKRKFLCKCSCGNEVEVRLDHMQSGHTSSCGSCGIEHAGKKMSLKQWAFAYGIKESTLRARLKTMSMQEALERR
jgi:hypothetical protein